MKCVQKKTHKKHFENVSSKKAADCEKWKNLGIKKYTEKVIYENPIGKGLKQMSTEDKKALVIKFNTAYYLAKNERRFCGTLEKLSETLVERLKLLTRNVLNLLNI